MTLVIIPEFGQRRVTNRLIESIPESYHDSIYVGNDGYADQDPLELIAGHEIKWDDNIGFAGNVNRTVATVLGIESPSPLETLMIVNNDIEVMDEAIGMLDDLVNRFPTWIVGPAILVPSKYVGRIEHRHFQFFDNNIVKPGTGIHFITALSGAFLCMSVAAWLKLGGFDSETFKAYFEDDSLCIEAHRAGFDVVACLNAMVKHSVGSTYRNDPNRQKQIKVSKLAFERKYPNIKWDHTGMYAID